MRVLITGSAGFAGGYLWRSLEADGHTVTGYNRADDEDVRDRKQIRYEMRQTEPDLIFHLAAVSDPDEARADPLWAVEVNCTGTANVLDAARRHAPHAKILIAGSSDEYGATDREPGEILTESSPCSPDGPYGASKLAATVLAGCYVRSYGLHVVVTRAFMHTGPGRRSSSVISGLAKQVVAVERGEAEHVEHGDLSARHDITDVRDMAQAYRVAIRQPPGIYNACSGALTSVRAVLAMLTSLSVLDDVPLRQNPAIESRPGLPVASCVPLTAAGWKPQFPLSTTLGGLLAYWRSQ